MAPPFSFFDVCFVESDGYEPDFWWGFNEVIVSPKPSVARPSMFIPSYAAIVIAERLPNCFPLPPG
jgi:hypothetical protein